MHRLLALIALLATAADPVSVEIRDTQVWLMRAGAARQLTRGQPAKMGAILSPSKSRIAYHEVCNTSQPCPPSVVVIDLDGRTLASFEPRLSAARQCANIASLVWAREGTIGVECHVGPALNEYVETGIATGQIERDLLGRDFARSPNGEHIAHVGRDDSLLIDNARVFPPAASSATHQLGRGLHWAPDSRRIAFIDCTPEASCAVVIAAMDGKTLHHPLTGSAQNVRLYWQRPRALAIEQDGVATMLNVE